jgi:transposase IS116/IS110/IS902 family protein
MARRETSPGVGHRAAARRSAALGIARSRLPRAKPLAAWAGLCPGPHERGGKRVRGQPRQGSRWLRQGRGAMAPVASHTPNPELAAPSKRSAARRGKPRALMAVGPPLLTLVSMMLTRKQPYQERGGALRVPGCSATQGVGPLTPPFSAESRMPLHAPRPMQRRRPCAMLARPRRCTVVGATLVPHARSRV